MNTGSTSKSGCLSCDCDNTPHCPVGRTQIYRTHHFRITLATREYTNDIKRRTTQYRTRATRRWRCHEVELKDEERRTFNNSKPKSYRNPSCSDYCLHLHRLISSAGLSQHRPVALKHLQPTLGMQFSPFVQHSYFFGS